MFWSNASIFFPVINFLATYFHIAVMMVIVYQSLYWKLSWTMIVFLFFAIGPWYSLDIDYLQTINTGKDKPILYYSDIAVRKQRYKKWRALMWVLILAWVIIFPSK